MKEVNDEVIFCRGAWRFPTNHGFDWDGQAYSQYFPKTVGLQCLYNIFTVSRTRS